MVLVASTRLKEAHRQACGQCGRFSAPASGCVVVFITFEEVNIERIRLRIVGLSRLFPNVSHLVAAWLAGERVRRRRPAGFE